MPPHRLHLKAILPGFLACASVAGHAAEYSITPGADVRAVIDSNRRLTTQPHSTVAGTESSAYVDLAMRTPTTDVLLQPKYRLRRFNGNLGLDSNDYFINLEGTHLFSPRHQFQLQASYDKESNGTTEPGEAGLNFTNVDRITRSLAPSFTYVHDEQTSATASFSASDTRFDQDQNSGFSDYTYKVASLQVTHALSDYDSITGVVFQSSFDLPASLSETTSRAVQLIYNRQFTPTLSGSAGYGYIRSRSEFFNQQLVLIPPGIPAIVLVPDAIEKSGQLIDLNLIKEFERARLEAAFNRTVSPSTRGAQNVRDEFTLSGRYRLSDYLSVNGEYKMYKNESQSGASRASLDRDFRGVRAALEYRIDEQWSINGGYAYREIEYDSITGNGGNPNSNLFFITLKFTGEPRTYSR